MPLTIQAQDNKWDLQVDNVIHMTLGNYDPKTPPKTARWSVHDTQDVQTAFNNINSGVFMPQHPRPEELHAAIETDFPRPRFVPVLPRHWPEMTVRTIPSYVSPKDYRLLASHDACGVAKERSLPLGSLVVEDAGAGLVVRTRDGRVSFDIIEAFAEPLSSLVINTFSMLPPEAHTPRVTLDGLIVCRESWRFKPSEMEFAFEKNEGARFAAARRWMREGGLPRFLFVKTKVERKPSMPISVAPCAGTAVPA